MKPGRSLIRAALLAGGASIALAAGEIPWNAGVNKALDDAKASSKPVFVDVWAVWCVPCKEMDETTYRDPGIVAAMAGFVPLKVDQDSSMNFCTRHGVEMLPLVLYLDGEGRELGRRAGLQRTDELLPSMQAVTSGYAGYLDAIARADKDAEAASAAARYLAQAGNSGRAVQLLRRALDGKPQPAQAEKLELELAEAQLASGEAKDAANGFRRLADRAAAAETKGRALAGLVRAERDRGKTAEADAALARLKAEFPELASGLGSEP